MSRLPDGEPGRRRYECWTGNPNGVPEKLEMCAMEVKPNQTFIYRQCNKGRTHGEFCGHHFQILKRRKEHAR